MNPNADDCQKWKENKLVNPQTNRKIKKNGPTYQIYEEKCDNDCLKFGGLKNIGGTSCFMDSVLFALFAIPNRFITKNILKKNLQNTPKICDNSRDLRIRKSVQDFLNTLTIAIRKDKNIIGCNKLRDQFKKCRIRGFENFGRNKQQESGEFLIYLLRLFGSENFATRKITTYATNSIAQKIPKDKLFKTSEFENRVSFVIKISSFELRNREDRTDNRLHYLLKDIDDSGELDENNLFYPENLPGKDFRRKISISSILDAPYLVFWVNRADPISQTVLRTKITPSQQITLPSGNVLKLNAIVVHRGAISSGHYITFFKCREQWYLYDDLNPRIKQFGTYNKMLDKYGKYVRSYGVLYFYT
jgi:ubiquitin C-terminal hydrolase